MSATAAPITAAPTLEATTVTQNATQATQVVPQTSPPMITNRPAQITGQAGPEKKEINPAIAIVIGVLIAVAFIAWKIFLFRHAARTSNGWSVFFATFVTPLDALSLLFKKKCVVSKLLPK